MHFFIKEKQIKNAIGFSWLLSVLGSTPPWLHTPVTPPVFHPAGPFLRSHHFGAGFHVGLGPNDALLAWSEGPRGGLKALDRRRWTEETGSVNGNGLGLEGI